MHCGDSLQVLKSLPERSVDAIITDPPYSSGGMFRGDRTRSTGDKYVGTDVERERVDFPGDNRDQRSFAFWCSLWFAECWRVAKDGASIAVFTDWRQLPTMTDIIQAGGWCWRGIVPWNKTEATRPQKGWFRSQCEYMVVGAKGLPSSYGSAEMPAMPGFVICPVERDNVHQTQKPVDLCRWLMQLCPRGGVVLDPFAGSGTTGVAAVMEGLSFIGVEMTEHYAAIARQRIAEAVPGGVQEALFE